MQYLVNIITLLGWNIEFQAFIPCLFWRKFLMQWKVLNKYEGTQFSGLLISAIRRDRKIWKRRPPKFFSLDESRFLSHVTCKSLKIKNSYSKEIGYDH